MAGLSPFAFDIIIVAVAPCACLLISTWVIYQCLARDVPSQQTISFLGSLTGGPLNPESSDILADWRGR